MELKVNVNKIYTLNIKKYRKKRKLTQKALAKKVSVSQTYISRLENNILQGQGKHPPFELLLSLSIVLKVCPHIMVTYNYSCNKNCLFICDRK